MKVRKLTLTAILTALAFVLNEFLVIPIPPTSSPLISLSLGVVPIFFIAYYCGIIYAIIGAVSADVLGFFLVGAAKGYAFNLGFTFNALLSGAIIGIVLLFKKKLEGEKGAISILISESILTVITIPLFIYFFLKTDLGAGHGGNALLFTVSVISVLLNFSVVIYAFFTKDNPDSNAIILSFLLYLYVVSLFLTPLWVISYAKGISYFYLWITRLITVPIEIVIYSLVTKLILYALKKVPKKGLNPEK